MESSKKLQDIKVAVDAVIFGYFDKKDLQILLIKRNIEPLKEVGHFPEVLFWMMKTWMMQLKENYMKRPV
jgi:hypothetical protein